jgi:hypothetical protein
MWWALAAVTIMVVILMMSNSARKLPWNNKMRRLRAGEPRAEWMAPEHVVQQVQADYLAALQWMQESPSQPWAKQWSGASAVMVGPFLRRYQNLLLNQRGERSAPCYGILRADHRLDVRGFSQDGRRCWLIDQQMGRRIATYNAQTHQRGVTQDMGDGAVVVALFYDARDERWKLETLVQELPAGWGTSRKLLDVVPNSPVIPRRIGRDN